MNAPAFDFPFGKPPPTVALFGWTLVSIDPQAGEIEVAFQAGPEFVNPAGFIQGGILTAMIDDAMGPIVVAHSQGRQFPTSIDLHTHFLRPVKPGPVTVKARVRQLGRTVAFLAAELYDSRGKLAATATSSAALVPAPGAPDKEGST